MQESINSELQRNMLALLLFSDQHYNTIRNTCGLNTWSGDHGIVSLVGAVYKYIDEFKKPPGINTFSLIRDLPLSIEQKELLQTRALTFEADVKSINSDYVFKSIEKFHKKAALQKAIQKGIEYLEAGDFEKAEEALMSFNKTRLIHFDAGQNLLEVTNKLLRDLQDRGIDGGRDTSKIRLNMDPLDRNDICPTRKELFVVMAAAGQGKTWFLVQIGKEAVLQGFKVLHVTLEMGVDPIAIRYLMNLFGYSKRQMERKFRITIKDDDFFVFGDEPAPVLDEAGLESASASLSGDPYLVKMLRIVQFPTNTLTMGGLRTYLDQLEVRDRFVPDLIIVDYADIMHIKNSENLRHELSTIYKDLRGLAIERNIMMVTACQSNKEGAKSTKIGAVHAAESWDKVAHADIIISYTSNTNEKESGLGRLNIVKARNAESDFQIVIAQNYEIGQFYRGGTRINKVITEKMNAAIDKAASHQGKKVI